ncbi:MAG: 3-dehydroquinate synthase, partial [Candidatus Omnitrophica bacterium]|nr:3-dehydroquinate synthase [Candidatus Omnitrophota bacterium]
MNTITVNLGKRSYKILTGAGLLSRTGPYARSLRLGEHAYIITNPRIRKLHGKALAASLSGAGIRAYFKLVPEGEKSKSIETASKILIDLARFAGKKNVFVVAFGGGVIG